MAENENHNKREINTYSISIFPKKQFSAGNFSDQIIAL